jgi:signal transduction histidine kinase
MVESTWHRESLTVQEGEFPDSQIQAVRDLCRQGGEELEKGNFPEAARLFREALEGDPRHPGAWHDLGTACYRMEQWAEALHALGKALELAPEKRDLLYKKGLCQLQAGYVHEAVETLEAAAQAGHLDAHYQLGLVLSRQSQQQRSLRARAIEHLEAVLQAVDGGQEYGGLDRVCFSLGGLYGEEADGRPQALKAYRRGLAINPLSAVGHNGLGQLLLLGGQVLGALGEFKVAIQLDPAFRAPYANLARLFFRHVRPAELEQEYRHIAQEFGKEAPQVLARLSLELVELGKQQVYEGFYTRGHQLKNLLGLLGSRLRGLGRKVRGEPSWGEELSSISAEHERLYEEWVGFLGAMKPEPVHPGIIEPARLVRKVAELVRSQAWKSRVVVRVQEGVPRIEADERMLREAITNLCLNALEVLAGQEGGQVILGVGYDEERAVVFVEVEDNGPGIGEEHLELIFEPGFTTKEQGNGYGLSIARRIVHAHHGELRVKSRKGHGTVFRMDLPLALEGGEAEESLSGLPARWL